MRKIVAALLFLEASLFALAQEFHLPDTEPAYVDSVWYGSADPSMLWNPVKKEFYMYYTQRRAELESEGVIWAEGTKIGIAASKDGRQWRYVGTCKGERLENPVEDDYSLWAPSVIYHKKKFHMYVSYVPSITGHYGKGIRYIKHYTSKD
ncbi:family 43 glycosylhydrolase [Proteiniphilum sp.]|uniref:family 43 glycosylhydrolase n=1 Tax=Proteiniphilum sp. TaxID=1926877 RepID=UPI0033324A16